MVLGETGIGEYFVVIEERVAAPRFGLDVERAGALTTWDGLAWTDFEGSGDHISTARSPGIGPTRRSARSYGDATPPISPPPCTSAPTGAVSRLAPGGRAPMSDP